MISFVQHKPICQRIPRSFSKNGGTLRVPRIPIATYKTLFLHKSPRSLIVPRASGIDWEFSSYIIGKGVILFTLYYCTMNWWFYRRTREDEED